MGRWVTAIVVVGAGFLLTALGLGQFAAAVQAPVGAASGHVVRVVADGAHADTQRYSFELAGRRFLLATTSLPHPSTALLESARNVTVEYDAGGRIMALSVDGAVFFTSQDYSIFFGASSFVALLPGMALLGFGVTLFGGQQSPASGSRTPQRRKTRKTFTLPEPTMAVILPFRRPQKTPDGEWVH